MQNPPKISVVIPVWNGASWLEACLRSIVNQSLFSQTEIIAIDSGSADNSMEILNKFPVRLYTIPSNEFNHGLTRQYGAELSRGEYVAMTVQDARPANERWLEELLRGFEAAENVAGVCGSQIVPAERDNNPVEWFRPLDTPEMKVFRYSSPHEFEALTPQQKMTACGWDDVTAMYRREVLLKVPFRKTSFSEDAIWAKDALTAGYPIVYNPAARVCHYHHEDFDFSFRRNLTVMYMRYKQFGCVYNRPAQNVRQTLSQVKTICLSKPLSWKERWEWFWYNQEQFKGRLKAYEVFAEARAKGETELDAVHERYCGKPPVHERAASKAPGNQNLKNRKVYAS